MSLGFEAAVLPAFRVRSYKSCRQLQPKCVIVIVVII